MPKGKRYILVEVDVNVLEDEAERGQQPNNLTSDSQYCFDSMCAEFERYGYADGTHVYGVQVVHPHNINDVAVHALHFGACEREISGLGRPCDRPDLCHDSDNKTLAEQLGAAVCPKPQALSKWDGTAHDAAGEVL